MSPFSVNTTDTQNWKASIKRHMLVKIIVPWSQHVGTHLFNQQKQIGHGINEISIKYECVYFAPEWSHLKLQYNRRLLHHPRDKNNNLKFDALVLWKANTEPEKEEKQRRGKATYGVPKVTYLCGSSFFSINQKMPNELLFWPNQRLPISVDLIQP